MLKFELKPNDKGTGNDAIYCQQKHLHIEVLKPSDDFSRQDLVMAGFNTQVSLYFKVMYPELDPDLSKWSIPSLREAICCYFKLNYRDEYPTTHAVTDGLKPYDQASRFKPRERAAWVNKTHGDTLNIK